MKKKRILLTGVSVIFLLFIFLIYSGVFAEESSPEKYSSESITEVEKLSEAYFLVKYGRETKSPLALLTAAEIMGSIKIVPGEKGPIKKNEADGAYGCDTEGLNIEADPFGLLEEAKIMSGENSLIVSLSGEIEEEIKKMQSVLNKADRGAVSEYSLIEPYETDIWSIPCDEGEWVSIEVRGNGSSNLDLFIYDKTDKLIGTDENKNDHCCATWLPEWSEDYRAEVVNRGEKNNNYVIIYNY